ncbi:MAG TPA: RHS repeat-associated core domain-containing protein [Thermoanaerobaculia bacterium]|nr:RHS repeat-associated core domain-containing protein [Thermoanaerobaculia bacterium]
MSFIRTAAVLLILSVAVLAAAQDGRYRVTVEVLPGDDPSAVARQLAATYRGQLEPNDAGEPAGGFVVSLSEASAKLFAADPRVQSMREVRTEAAGTWYLGPYSYDGAGNIKSVVTPEGTDYFVYDAFSRLKSGTAGPGRSQAYTYDDFGNIKSIVTDGTVTTLLGVNPANNRIDNAAYEISGTYNASGQMLTYNGADTFVYDGLGMVRDATVDSSRQLYLYSPGNERIATVWLNGTTEGRSEWTLRDTSGAVLRRFSRLNGNWTWEEDYIYRGEVLLAAEIPTSAKTLHFHVDHLGTPRLITGNGGVQIAKHDYYPYGQEVTSAAQDAEKKKFTGHERDSANLDYMHARFARPFIGRFISPDPVVALDLSISQPQTWNRYSYGANNPMKYPDPTGEIINVSHLDSAQRLMLLASLLAFTGNEYGIDGSGNLYLIRLGPNSSESATWLINEAIKACTVYEVQPEDDTVINMGRVNPKSTNAMQLDFEDFKTIVTPNGIDREASGIGEVFMHELAHMFLGLKDPEEGKKTSETGPTIDWVNTVHRERGFPLRGPTYAPQVQFTGGFRPRYRIPFIDPATGKTIHIEVRLRGRKPPTW